jgi:small GTP-binding protein
VIPRLLDDHRQALLDDERALLGEVRDGLARAGAADEDHAALAGSVAQLDGLFLLVVVGEFNAGKSALINALLGQEVQGEGVTPTTSKVALLAWGDVPSREVLSAGLERVAAPVDLLREVGIVDTPGTNAVLREHEVLTRQFVPRADLVLFVTSADRPFAESERAFLEAIRAWGKTVVVVLNKQDILRSSAETREVTAFVREKAGALLGTTPEVFPVSARQALLAKTVGPQGALAASGLPALEGYVASTLDETERLRLKLENPRAVAARLVLGARESVEGRLGLLKDDVAAFEEIEAELDLYREDLARDFRFRLADVDNLLHAFERRGHAFFDDTLRTARVLQLLDRERVRGDFERRVVAEMPREVEARVGEIAGFLVGRELTEWQGLLERLLRRQSSHEHRMFGRVGSLARDRQHLLEDVRRAAQRAIDGYDHAAEARHLAQAVRDAVAGAALLQVGAVGLGAAVTVLATTTFADVTGLVAAGTLSVVGLLLLPHRRSQARRALGRKVEALRDRLMATLTGAFDAEVSRSLQAMREAMAPYTRFVRAEGARLQELKDEMVRLEGALAGLEARIRAL